MNVSIAPRLCFLLAAGALNGCFDPAPEMDDEEGGNGSTTQSADPTTAETSGQLTNGTTTEDSGTGTSTTRTGSTSMSDDGTSTSDGDTSTGEQDREPPSIESMTPADGATGVRADATVLFVFSEPMDTASVEAALDTGTLGGTTLSWNDDGTELTITPADEIPYATGSGPLTVDPLEFTVTLSQDAADLTGNPLESAWSATFSSARRLVTSLSIDPAYTGGVISDGVLQSGAGDNAVVGDHADNLGRRGFFGFPISSLPDGVLEFEQAELRAAQVLVLGDPMPALGNTVTIAHIAPEVLPGGAYDSAIIADLGAFSTDEADVGPDNVKSANVTAALDMDYDSATSHTQYRLALDIETNGDNGTDRLRYNSEVLEVTYLLP